MRLVIQRVKKASVSVDNKTVGKIESGLFVLVGVKEGDTKGDADYLAEKLAKLRVMADKNDKMNLSVKDLGASLLIVSQFTLYADASGGNRPSFINAAKPEIAKDLYEYFISKLKEKGLQPRGLPSGAEASLGRSPARRVETGSFGDHMKIETVLDGPVTIIIESNKD